MAEILLTTLNARYLHAAFGLRCLLANMGPLQSRTRLAEFDINQRPLDIAEKILGHDPRIVGLGVYIWNAALSTELVALLKRLRPGLQIVLGGPEVSYECDRQQIVRLADYVITGEADLEFGGLCERLLTGDRPRTKIIPAPLPEFSQLRLPYEFYTAEDVAHRVVYVEASRGCPFTCDFCLSSLDIPVRQASLPEFLQAMQGLLDRGLKHFKFVDRTFNLNLATSKAILRFFLERHQPGHFYHFELVPDRLPAALREVVRQFPPGSLQFEVGVQTFNPEVGALIHRRQNYEKLEDNLRFLRNETGIHIHADLIAGLPGETLESFGAGFDRLTALKPQEVQVGILKRLRGTPIALHDEAWEVVYSPLPPYEILQNKLLDFGTLQKLRRFARYWDLVSNSGNFVETTPLLWSRGESPFTAFMDWSQWLYEQVGKTDSIALPRLAQALFDYLTSVRGLDPTAVAQLVARDYRRPGRRDVPAFLFSVLKPDPARTPKLKQSGGSLKRQLRRLSTGGASLPAS